MRISNILFPILSATLLSSCCTKVDCAFVTYPQILIQVNRPSGTPVPDAMIVRLDKSSNQGLDSISVSYRGFFELYPDRFHAELKDFNYAFHAVNGPSDTLTDINYNKYVDKVECNSCFPFGHDYAERTTYADLTYQHEGNTYHDGDTLTLTW